MTCCERTMRFKRRGKNGSSVELFGNHGALSAINGIAGAYSGHVRVILIC